MRFILMSFLAVWLAYGDEICDLNKKACELYGSKLELKEKTPKAMQENVLLLTSKIKSPQIQIKGVEMDMGKMPIKGEKTSYGMLYRFIPSGCVSSKMSYDVFLYDGTKSLGRVGRFTIKH